MANDRPSVSGKGRKLTKKQAMVVMAIGVILFAQAFFISTEMGTYAHWTKMAVALAGIILLFVGSYLRPLKEAPQSH